MVSAKISKVTRPILVFGFGNPGWQDDGVGAVVVDELEKRERQYVAFDSDFQLYFEHAVDMARYEKVLFIDASLLSPEPFTIKKITPAKELIAALSYTSHYLSPEALLALCQEHFLCAPETWLVGIKIYRMDINEPITGQARENAEQARRYISTLLDEWELSYQKYKVLV